MTTPELIHPSKIESELDQIWESLQGSNKMRACLFNLIIYTKKNERRSYLQEVAQKVIQKFPSRILFVTIDDSHSTEEVKASVSVINADESQNAIVCDLIAIEVSGSHSVKVPFVILPHILPDLPVYLVWADDPTNDDPVLKKMVKFATRVIYDSETTNNLPKYAQEVSHQIEEEEYEITDLNWARIESWRNLFAGTFYNLQQVDILQNAKHIRMEYNCEESKALCRTKIQSIYLQSWLASRFGWEYKKVNNDKKGFRIHYEFEGQPIEVQLVPNHNHDILPGRILSIEIETYQEHHYTFKRNESCPFHIDIIHSTKETCSIPTQFIMDKAESGQSLVREICHKGTSRHYRELLALLSKSEMGDFV